MTIKETYTPQEVFEWLNNQAFQKEQGEQEYTMIYEIDLPKIINKFIKDHQQQAKADRDFCNCLSSQKHGSTSAMHCNHCGKIESSETWLK
jgi:hypothetical protein